MDRINTQLHQRLIFTLIILVCALPFAGAWYVYNFTDLGKHQENNSHGTLIIPPGLISDSKLLNPVTGDINKSLHGKWNLVYLESGDCARECIDALDIAKQLRAAMANNTGRIQIILAIDTASTVIPAEIVQNGSVQVLIWPVDDVLTSEIYTQIRLSRDNHTPEKGAFYLIDPIGNMMMMYPPGSDPAGMLKDLKRLLRYSRIG